MKKFILLIAVLLPTFLFADGAGFNIRVGRPPRNYRPGHYRYRVYRQPGRTYYVRPYYHPSNGFYEVYQDQVPRATGSVSLVPEESTIKAGEPFRLTLVIDVPDGQSILWEASQYGPDVAWGLPPGFKVERERDVRAEQVTFNGSPYYGYTRDRALTYVVTPPNDLQEGQMVDVQATIEFLSCTGNACMRVTVSPNIQLRVGD